MVIIRFLVGTAVLTLGRQLFWIFVGAAGFVLGLNLATRLFQDSSEWLIILLALIAGLVGALLAVFLQQLAVAGAGFVVGGFLVTSLMEAFNLSAGRLNWLVYLVAGIIGAALVLILFDWALIGMSSLAGAALMVNAFSLPPLWRGLAFVGLALVGFFVQASLMQRQPPADRIG